MTLIPRRRWNCGEADWLTAVAGADPKALLGYPMHFTARQVALLHSQGVTAEQAFSASLDHELHHFLDVAPEAEWGPLGYQT